VMTNKAHLLKSSLVNFSIIAFFYLLNVFYFTENDEYFFG
jgi:hypothetical protein